MKRIATTAVLAAAIVFGSATAATAAPVPEPEGICYPGEIWVVGHCEDDPRTELATAFKFYFERLAYKAGGGK